MLLCGAIGMPWSRFLVVVSLANLGLSAAYAALGYYAGQEGNLAVALAASIALPLAGTVVAQQLLPTETADRLSGTIDVVVACCDDGAGKSCVPSLALRVSGRRDTVVIS